MLLNALFKLAFAVAPDVNSLTLQHKITRRLILQQARHHTINSALTDCKLTVSGSISLSFSLFFSPFHHCTRSLYRVSRAPPYSGYLQEIICFHLHGYHVLWLNFPVEFN